MQTVLETKASIEDMNEALQHKANKQSVANALHRKANRSDIDQILETKADASDLEKLINLIEGKADSLALENVVRNIEAKVDKAEMNNLRSEIGAKVDRGDLDVYIRAVQGQRVDFETRQSALEKDFDGLVDTIKRELESLKQTTMISLSKKADFSLVDTLRESLQRKVDSETMATTASKIKSENQNLFATWQSEQNLIRKQRDEAVEDRFSKFENLMTRT